jgi:diguanylate cyclase (GGDEF)-like protein
VNDTFGHNAGDKVLYEVARIIEKNIRKGDIAARFGGEEYIILLIECKEEDAYVSAERIRRKVEQTSIEYLDKWINITISCGLCSISDINDFDADEIIRRADRALYASKQNGRNTTTIYRP